MCKHSRVTPLHHQQSRANPFFYFWLVRRPSSWRLQRRLAPPGRPAGHKVRVTCGGSVRVCWDSYPGFLGSLSRVEPPPFSLRTSFSLLRRIDARSLLKEPLLFREPEPSWWETAQSYSHTLSSKHTHVCILALYKSYSCLLSDADFQINKQTLQNLHFH